MKFKKIIKRLLLSAPLLLLLSCSEDKTIEIKMQSAYPTEIKYLGEQPYRFSELVEKLSEGKIKINILKPDEVVKTLDLEKAVHEGSIDAAFSGLGYTAEENPTLGLFTSVPFGPVAMEYAGWMYNGGGLQLLQKHYESSNFIIFPGILLPPEASGWYKENIKSPQQLKGLTIRAYGLGRPIFEKLGAKTVMMGGADIYQAMKDGRIDAVEFSNPSADLDLKLYEVADYYYFPGWHQPSTFLFMYFNKDLWNSLTKQQRKIIQTAANYLTLQTYSEIEHAQHEALDILQQKTHIVEWSPEMLKAFREAWSDVSKELSEKDPDFKIILEDIQQYRSDYLDWEKLNKELKMISDNSEIQMWLTGKPDSIRI